MDPPKPPDTGPKPPDTAPETTTTQKASTTQPSGNAGKRAPRKKKAETTITAEDVKRARDSLPKGVYCFEFGLKRAEFYRDQGLVAGYLKNCPNTDTLRSLFTKNQLLFEEYVALRGNGWTTLPGLTKQGVKDPTTSSLLKFFESVHMTPGVAQILVSSTMEIDRRVVRDLFNITETNVTEYCAFLTTINVCLRVLNQNEDQFFHRYVPDIEAGAILPNLEDFHRAYALLRCWIRVHVEQKQNKRPATSNKTRVQNNTAKLVTYVNELLPEEQDNSVQGPIEVLNNAGDLSFDWDLPSDDEEGVDDATDPLEVVNLLSEDNKSEENAPKTNPRAKLAPMTHHQKRELYMYAIKHTTTEGDHWTEGPSPLQNPDQEVSNIIETMMDSAMNEEAVKALCAHDEVDHATTRELSHASRNTPTVTNALMMLSMEEDRVLTPNMPQSVKLHPHQVNGVAAMFEMESESFQKVQDGKPALRAGILADTMGLGKTLTTLSFILKAWDVGVLNGKGPARPTVVTIPPVATQSWWSDYSRFFLHSLSLWFVGSFRRGNDPVFSSHCISEAAMAEALTHPEKSQLYKHKATDPGRTVFVVSHFTFRKYFVEAKTTKERDVATDDDESNALPMDLRSERKETRKERKVVNNKSLLSTDNKSSTPNSSSVDNKDSRPAAPETEDLLLVEETTAYDKYITTYRSKFPGCVYRVVVDEGHCLRHPSSGISRAVKLLEPDFLWVVSATPLLNKTRDFYGYAHLFYPTDLRTHYPDLEEFLKRPTIDKFQSASSEEEKLELFNPLYIRRLSTNGHMEPDTAAVVIPKLLKMTLIRRSQQTVIDGRRIGEAIPPKHINAVTLRMSSQEQLEYCAFHLKHTKQPLTLGTLNDGTDIPIQDSTRVRALQVTSLFPKISEFHKRVGLKKTRAAALKNLAFQPDFGLSFFLRYCYPADAYHHVVPSTRFDRHIELMRMSPIARYLTKVLYEMCEIGKEKVAVFAHGPNAAWLASMVCSNFGTETTWLRGGMTQEERDVIINDFNNEESGRTEVLVTTDRVGGFGANLQLGGCRAMVLIELPHNLNTMFQTMARTHRLGQKRDVYVWVLTVDHTFQRYWCANFARKAISDISAQLGGQVGQVDGLAERAVDCLNVLMGWGEDRSGWGDLAALNLEMSNLSMRGKELYKKIGGIPVPLAPGDTPKKTRKSQRGRNVVHGQQPCEPASAVTATVVQGEPSDENMEDVVENEMETVERGGKLEDETEDTAQLAHGEAVVRGQQCSDEMEDVAGDNMQGVMRERQLAFETEHVADGVMGGMVSGGDSDAEINESMEGGEAGLNSVIDEMVGILRDGAEVFPAVGGQGDGGDEATGEKRVREEDNGENEGPSTKKGRRGRGRKPKARRGTGGRFEKKKED